MAGAIGWFVCGFAACGIIWFACWPYYRNQRLWAWRLGVKAAQEDMKERQERNDATNML